MSSPTDLDRLLRELGEAGWAALVDPQACGEMDGHAQADAAWDRARECGLVHIDVDPDTLEERYNRTPLGDQLLQHTTDLFAGFKPSEVGDALLWSLHRRGARGPAPQLAPGLLDRLRAAGFVDDAGHATPPFIAMVGAATDGKIAYPYPARS